MELGGQGHILAGGGRHGGGSDGIDAQHQAVAHPDGRSDGQVAVSLGHTQVVVGVAGIQLGSQNADGQRSGIGPGVGHLAGVDDQLSLDGGVGGIGVLDGDVEAELLRHGFDDGAHGQVVDGIGQLKVLILGGVDPAGPDGIVDALLGEAFGQDHVTGVVAVAPFALVVVLVVGGGHMPALVQSQGVLLIAGVVAAGTHLALAVADLDELDDGIIAFVPVGEVGEVAKGGTGVVQLGDGVLALRPAQQAVVQAHTGIGGLVVQGGVVAGDDAGGCEGVHMTGTAGPGHLEATQGDDLGLGGVEIGDGVLIALPGLLGEGGGQAHVVEGTLGIGLAGLVEVVGVVGEGHEIHIGLLGQGADVLQSGLQGAGAVGIGGVGVELTEVHLIVALAHDEAPGLGDGFAVGTGDGQGHGDTAVGHVSGGGVGDEAVLQNSLNGLAVDQQFYGGSLAHVGQLGRNGGALVVLGLGVGQRQNVGDHGLVLDLDDHGGLDGDILVVQALDGDGQAFALDQVSGDLGGVALTGNGQLQLSLAQVCGDLLDTEQSIHGEVEQVALTGIGGSQIAEDGHGLIDHAVGDLVGGAGIEMVGEHIPVGDRVHAPGGEVLSKVLQILHVAVEHGGAAAQTVAAVVLLHDPVGIGGVEGVEGVVAAAGGAQVAEGGVEQAVVLPVLLNLKDQSAVGADGLAALDGSSGGENGAGGGDGGVTVHAAQNALGGLVVEDDLIALGGQTGTLVALLDQLVDADGLLTGGAVAGEDANGVVADGVGLLVQLGGDGGSAVCVDGDAPGAVDGLARLGAQQVAAVLGGVEVAGVLAVGGVECPGVGGNAGLQGDDLGKLVVAEAVIGLDDLGVVAVVVLLGGAQGVVVILGDDQDAVAGLELGNVGDQNGLILSQHGRNVDGVGKGDFLAVLHALLHGLDSEGGILGDGDGGGVLNPVAVAGVIEDGRALGGAGEGNFSAGIHHTGLHRGLGSGDHIAGLHRAAIAGNGVEADGVHGLGGIVVGRPVILVGVPLQVGALTAADVVLVGLALDELQGPGGCLLGEAQVGAADDGQLLTGGIGEAHLALGIHGDVEDVVLAPAGQGVAVQGQGGAVQVVILVHILDLVAQTHGVGGIVDDDPVTALQRADELAGGGGAGGEELHHVGLAVPLLVGVGGEVLLVVLQIQRLIVVLGSHIGHQEAALDGLGVPQAVLGGGVLEGQHVAAGAGCQVLALGIGEEPCAAGIGSDGQLGHALLHGQNLILHNAGNGAQNCTAGGIGQDAGIAGVVDEDLHAVRQLGDQNGFTGAGSGGLGGIGHHRLRGLGDDGLRRLGGLGGNHGSGATLDPEADGLTHGVAGGPGLVAAPVQTLDVDAQIAHHIAGAACHDGGEIVALGIQVPHSGSLADAGAVVGIGGVEVAVFTLDGVAALRGGDGPAEAVTGGGQGVPCHGADLGHGLSAAACGSGGQDVGNAVLAHGDGDGILSGDVAEIYLRPCGCSFFCKGHDGEHGDDHDHRQQQCQKSAVGTFHAFSSFVFSPVFRRF